MKRGAPLLIPAAGVLWGILGIFVRRLNESGLASMDIVWIRAAVTTLVLLPILFLRRKGEWRIRLRDLRCFLGTGIGSIVFFNFCYFQAVTITSLSVAAVLLYTAPAFVIVLSALFFKEKITGGKIAALLLTLFGLMLVTGMIGSGTRLSLQGLLFGLGAGLGYALYSIFGRFAIQRGYRPLTITFYTFLVAAVASAFLTGGVLCTVAPFALYTTGLQHVENGAASIMASIEPVTSTVAGALLYGEVLSPANLAGVVLVLAGVVLGSLPERSRP